MTDEFDAARKRLWDDLVELHDAWAQYRYLFADEERVRMLNACAGWFFGVVQRTLIRNVLLGVARMTDRIQSGPFTNLAIGTLLEDPKVADYPDLRAQLTEAIGAVTDKASDIRIHRHKQIAHRDHATAVSPEDQPLPGVTAESITEILQDLGDIYNLHGGVVHESGASFELAPIGGADALIRILEQSERWEKWQEWDARKRRESGG